MKTENPIEEPLPLALETIRRFIAATTGVAPTDQEIADALKRYFVLNEIKGHILMARDLKSNADPRS